MTIAIPSGHGKLTSHFGHCAEFALFDVDADSGIVTGHHTIAAPPHEPGLLPKFLSSQNVDVVIAGGMGSRAKALFDQVGITVITGAPEISADEVVKEYLAGKLKLEPNACDH